MLPLQVFTEAENPETANKIGKCRICHVKYGSDADISSHWIQCCPCMLMVDSHASCSGIH